MRHRQVVCQNGFCARQEPRSEQVQGDARAHDWKRHPNSVRFCRPAHRAQSTERWDGGGYPNGLRGSDIHLWGRICAVGDVFDAVTSERPYKPASPNEEALQVLKDGRGKHFDPRVVDVFFECLDEILAIQAKYVASDQLP